RSGDADLTLATLQDRFGLPAVMVSRIENAARAFDRWNVETVQSLCALFGVTDRAALASHLRREFGEGTLDDWLPRVPGAAERQKQTRDRVAALRAELEREPVFAPPPRHDPAHPHAMPQQPAVRSAPPLLTIMGVPIGDGLIEPFPGPQSIAPPPGTGARAYALRMCRTSLGDTIPGSAVLIVDPDRYPVHGGIAVLQEKRGLRVITVTTDRSGHLFGHSINPKKQIALDAYAPADLAMVTAVLFP
ncbi:MAG: XRE family transcriptional regulator, partial [Sphingobium sp.]